MQVRSVASAMYRTLIIKTETEIDLLSAFHGEYDNYWRACVNAWYDFLSEISGGISCGRWWDYYFHWCGYLSRMAVISIFLWWLCAKPYFGVRFGWWFFGHLYCLPWCVAMPFIKIHKPRSGMRQHLSHQSVALEKVCRASFCQYSFYVVFLSLFVCNCLIFIALFFVRKDGYWLRVRGEIFVYQKKINLAQRKAVPSGSC